MADPTSLSAAELSGAARDEDRDKTIESLLVTGLDLYFAGDHERAMHAWTRVLFLDRSHTRARAYIERTRSVVAERQRETDELLHRGLAALDAGETEHARTLLASAVERGGAVEAAEVALERLVRLNVATGDVSLGPLRLPTAVRETPGPRRHRRLVPWFLAIAAVPLLLIAAALAFRWELPSGWAPARQEPGAYTAPRVPQLHPPPYVSDLAVRRARSLFARGHLHQALAELDRVPIDDPRRAEADRLQAEVQRALLGAIVRSAPGASAATAGRP